MSQYSACPWCGREYPVEGSLLQQCCDCGGTYEVAVPQAAAARLPFEYSIGPVLAPKVGNLGLLRGRLIAWANRRWSGYVSAYFKTLLQCWLAPGRAYASVPVRGDAWGALSFALVNSCAFWLMVTALFVLAPDSILLRFIGPFLPIWRVQVAHLGGVFALSGIVLWLTVVSLGYSIGCTHVAALLTGGARMGWHGSFAAVCYGTAWMPVLFLCLMAPMLMLLFLFFSIYLPVVALGSMHRIGLMHGFVVWVARFMIYFAIFASLITAMSAGFLQHLNTLPG